MTKSSVKRKCFTLNTSDSFSLVVCSYFISVFPGEKWRSKPPNTIKKKDEMASIKKGYMDGN